VCEVTVAGPVDPITGFAVDLALLDRVLEREVRERLDHRNLNLDVAEFGEGGLMPTGENLARVIAERVQAGLGAAARVTRVVVAEDSTLSTTYEPD
jgi:6-pyruvoyltetrahydropterin/6-carboxytetrahydropterin synthase